MPRDSSPGGGESTRPREAIDDSGLPWSRIDHPAFECDERLWPVRQAVLSDPSKVRDNKAGAEVACLNVHYFGDLFKREIGVGFPEWVHLVRIREACRLLSRNYLRIGQLADRVGYERVETFRDNFKRLVGVSPREYRRRCKP